MQFVFAIKSYLLFLSAALFSCFVTAQTPCTVIGQNPSTAFPVCGTNVYKQSTVPVCGGRRLPSPSCATDPIGDKNPFWYKFTCYRAGSLGFLITPKDLNSDYDWELYDITGKNPDDVYTDGTLVVSSNWSGETGLTGASAAGTQRFVCAGVGKPLFSSMPNIRDGRDYLLLVSHFSNTQAGYDLEFKGGSAIITDTLLPLATQADPNCGGDVITVKLNKKIKCSSIATDGSDFFITPASGSPVTSIGLNCTTKFDTDSLRIRLNAFLPPGNYKLNIKRGSDGNTLLDYCDQAVPTTNVVDFTIAPIAPTPMDSIAPVKCSPNTLRLVFSKLILCSSIAPNGSDFRINGSYPVTISSATGSCQGSAITSREIILSLSQPLQKSGNFTLVLQSGSDGNTLVNDCGAQSVAGSSVSFSLRDTVNADFTYAINYSCSEDVVNFSHSGQNGVNQWKWNLDDNFSSTLQNPQGRYRVFDQKNIELIVSNGFCADTSRQSFLLDNFLTADFIVATDNCHSEPVTFKTNSKGKIINFEWQMGDGQSETGDTISHTYAPPPRTTSYTVTHIVTDSYGCTKSVQKTVNIYVNCQIDVPNAFTPNGDGKNDLLYPLNAIKAEQLDFKVYNRWGQVIFKTTDWKKGWDGKYNGELQPSGTYVWMLQYIHRDTQQRVQKKGSTILVR